MRIGIVGDIHFCQYSSIVRSRGSKYSTRLENCINSINWAEETLADCDEIIYLGDFFDNSNLNAEELSALKEIKWSSQVPHAFLVGNHEMWSNDLMFNSANFFQGTIDTPIKRIVDDVELCYLPYQLEVDDNTIKNIFGPKTMKRIIFSHNDVKGIQMGPITSPHGLSLQEISEECDRFINGHLHNGRAISWNAVNVGNLTGQNFGEDATTYSHGVYILHTDHLGLEEKINPHAFNFYKIDATEVPFVPEQLKDNAVITARILEKDHKHYKELLENASSVVAFRFTIMPESSEEEVAISRETLSINHLAKFDEFVKEKLGTSEGVLDELAELLI